MLVTTPETEVWF